MKQTFVPFIVRGFVPDTENGQPILLLQDEEARFVLPIWVGVPEAGAIACVLQGQTLPRPMTHDLLATVVRTLGATVDRVDVRAIEAGTFLADLWLRTSDGTLVCVDCRPSDAIALAVRTDAPIRVAAAVLEAAQPINPEDVGGPEAAAGSSGPVASSPLEAVSADDADARARLALALATMDPEAFGKFRT
jgi:bifunctional DNase/RNase